MIFFLRELAGAIASAIESTPVSNVFRYVDEFILLNKKSSDQDVVSPITVIFHAFDFGLTFTFDKPKKGVLPFLPSLLIARQSLLPVILTPFQKRYPSLHILALQCSKERKRVLQPPFSHKKVMFQCH